MLIQSPPIAVLFFALVVSGLLAWLLSRNAGSLPRPWRRARLRVASSGAEILAACLAGAPDSLRLVRWMKGGTWVLYRGPGEGDRLWCNEEPNPLMPREFHLTVERHPQRPWSATKTWSVAQQELGERLGLTAIPVPCTSVQKSSVHEESGVL